MMGLEETLKTRTSELKDTNDSVRQYLLKIENALEEAKKMSEGEPFNEDSILWLQGLMKV